MSVSTGTIYANKSINYINAYHKATFRSNFFLSKVKHCFEATLTSSCRGFHIGFSPTIKERSFVSFCPDFSNKPIFVERFESSDLQINTDLSMIQGEAVMACLDSSTSSIKAIVNNQTREYTFTKIADTKEWYALIDATSYCTQTSSASLSVNLGNVIFKNTIPKGYSPFIKGCFQSNLCNRKTSCLTRRSHIMHIYITLITTCY